MCSRAKHERGASSLDRFGRADAIHLELHFFVQLDAASAWVTGPRTPRRRLRAESRCWRARAPRASPPRARQRVELRAVRAAGSACPGAELGQTRGRPLGRTAAQGWIALQRGALAKSPTVAEREAAREALASRWAGVIEVCSPHQGEPIFVEPERHAVTLAAKRLPAMLGLRTGNPVRHHDARAIPRRSRR